MSTVTDKLKDAGKAVGEAAAAVGKEVVKAGGNAVEFVKEKTGIGQPKDHGVSNIKEHMPVIASCGKQVGTVDHLEGDQIKLTKSGSADGQHHLIPTAWVSKVDTHVHLSKNSVECESGMKSGSCGC